MTAAQCLPGQKPITPRWTPMTFHAEQSRLWTSPARFRVCHSGRRSGKTEILKRWTVSQTCASWRDDARFVLAAPTRDQAKAIYWEDIKALFPPQYVAKISESDLSIQLIHGPKALVVGMDKPYRIEGAPLDGIGLDEYGNMKPETWAANIRPALATKGREGWAWFIGVPEGRNHYYQLYKQARKKDRPDWDVFWWPSKDILAKAEIEAMRQDLDPAMFRQEAEGSWEMFAGRAYYGYEQTTHARMSLEYNPRLPLIFCFDFNVSPGTASVWQEFEKPSDRDDVADEGYIGCIGEVWIPKNSKTHMVCKKLIQDWGHHKGEVNCYGDVTGGAGGTSQTRGSDWDQIDAHLSRHWGDEVYINLASHNPRERARVNALNARCRTADGKIHLLVDAEKAPHMNEDFEGVRIVEGSAGDLDKKGDMMLTHLTDGIGYFCYFEYPTQAAFEGQIIV